MKVELIATFNLFQFQFNIVEQMPSSCFQNLSRQVIRAENLHNFLEKFIILILEKLKIRTYGSSVVVLEIHQSGNRIFDQNSS